MSASVWLCWVLMAWSALGTLSYLIVDTWPKAGHVGWVWYSFVQLIMGVATVVGWLLLVPFCLTHAWTEATKHLTNKAGRPICQWSWRPLNWVYGNPEDGVSGACALIWLNGTTQGPYTPPLWSGGGYTLLPLTRWNAVKVWLWVAWRAYCWSAWRNSCDTLKYEFAWNDGPYAETVLFGRTLRFGWHPESGIKVPVF